MKENYVVFKGSKDSIMIILDPEVPFSLLKAQLEEKLVDAQKFFKGAQASLKISGREISEEEELELINIIKGKSGLKVTFIHKEEKVEDLPVIQNKGDLPTKYYKGTIRSGQTLRYPGHIMIFGDVNPGGEVIAEGNVFVFGIMKGIAHAGANGNVNNFIIASELRPMQLRISNYYTRQPEDENKNNKQPLYTGPMEIAYVHEEQMLIEPLDKKSLTNLIM